MNSDPKRYVSLIYDLRDQFANGHNDFPMTVRATYNRLNAREKLNRDKPKRGGAGNNQVGSNSTSTNATQP